MSRLATLKLYTPHVAQLKFHQMHHQFKVVSWGRQSGKSTGANNEMVSKAWQKPGTNYWFVTPTADQAMVQYRRMVQALFLSGVLKAKNQTEKRIKLINNSTITYKSGESFDNLRAETLHGVVIDEVRDQRRDLWPMVIMPMLGTTNGWAIFTSTPNGYDHFYDLALRGMDMLDPNWGFMSVPSTANPFFSQMMYDEARKVMTEEQFAQEILAQFRDLAQGRAYNSYGDHNKVLENPFAPKGKMWSPYLPIILGADFNVDPMAWVLGQKKAEHWHWEDEIWKRSQAAGYLSMTQFCANLLVEKVKNHEPGVIICGDRSGKSRSTSGQTDYHIIKSTLKEAGITVSDKTPDANPLVRDRVNTVNAKCLNSKGDVQMTLNAANCPKTDRDLLRTLWKKSGGDLDKTKDLMLTHASDALGYPIHALDPLKFSGKNTGMKVLSRSTW
jgi:hypothetical protein